MRGHDEPGRILLTHRLLDLGNRLRPILLEIGQDADEPRPELGPVLLEIFPIDDVPSRVGHTLLLVRRTAPAVVPTGVRVRRIRVKFSLAPSLIERVAAAAKIEP